MRTLILIALLSPATYAQSLLTGKLVCISKGIMFNTKTQAVLSESTDSEGLRRKLNGVPVECERNSSTLKCSTSNTTVLVNLYKVKRDPGITLPLGGTAGAYNYYNSKLKKSTSLFSRSVRCRGPVKAY